MFSLPGPKRLGINSPRALAAAAIFSRPSRRASRALSRSRSCTLKRMRRETARAHRSITAAIRAQDSDAAVRRMERHVYAYAKAVIEVEERTEISIPDTD